MEDGAVSHIALFTPMVLWVSFAVLAVFFLIISIMLTYHWKNYSLDLKKINRIKRYYFVISALFLAGMVVSILLYTL